MKSLFQFLSLRKNYDALIAGLIGWLIIYAFTRHGGIGVSPDSIVYTSTARNLYAHKGLMGFDSMPMVDFPAGYPLFLSGVLLVTQHDPVVAGPALNGFLFGLLIFLCGCLVQREQAHARPYKWVMMAALAMSPALLNVYVMLWSETLFIVEMVIFLALLHHYFKVYTLSTLLLAAACAGFASITRYAGVTFIVTGGVLVFWDFSQAWKKKWLPMGLFALVSCSFLAMNLWHNVEETGTLTGPREAGTTPLLQNLQYYGGVLGSWTGWFQEQYGWEVVIGLICYGVLSVVFLLRAAKRKGYGSYVNIATAFFLVFVGFIVLSATVSRFEPINNRLLVPAFLPLLWGVTGWLPVHVRYKTRRGWWWLAGGLAVLLLTGEVKESYRVYKENNDYGIPGYTDDSWRLSPFVELLTKHPFRFDPAHAIYSNAPEAVYFFTGAAAASLPHTISPEDIADYLSEDSVYLVLFDNIQDPDLVSMEFLRMHQEIAPIVGAADGSINRVRLLHPVVAPKK